MAAAHLLQVICVHNLSEGFFFYLLFFFFYSGKNVEQKRGIPETDTN